MKKKTTTEINMMQWHTYLVSGAALLSAFVLGGCATNGTPGDPLEPLNRGIYQFNDTVDKAVLKPVATGYKEVLPSPVRTGVSNFFSNLDDVLVVMNDVFQFKIEQGLADFSRLFVNSTIGVAGVFDVATPWGMEKHNEDFGQTLGKWGIGNGAYLVLPFLGPSTVRDGVGRVVDAQADPVMNVDHIPTRNSMIVLDAVDRRARLLEVGKVLDEAALDPYVFVREAYLQRRRSLVYDGHPPREKFNDDE
jgi:phospholipid-binding lipoprotein MlaA